MNELTTSEKRRLANLEEIIERGVTSFLEVGRALADINDEQLWLEGYKSFEDYCRKRWGFSRSYGYRLIQSAQTVENVSTVLPIGDKGTKPLPPPKKESIVREIAKVETEQEQADLWAKVHETTSPEKVTAAKVAKVRRELFGDNGKPKAKPSPKKPPKSKAKDDKSALVRTAISYLDYAQRAIDDAADATGAKNRKPAVDAVQKAMGIVKGWK